MKRRSMFAFLLLFLLGGEMAAAAEREVRSFRQLMEERGVYWNELKGKEVWRRELGRERSLLLYVDENKKYHVYFTDGPWVYLTEELVERVKDAGLKLWEDSCI